ncbi:hypothetical protein CANCADRAFT_32828 [Tortispora caseinolytica NRRL Y-17796]|uniref:amidase n=1 Tax=Tortispora caseinolytica NRRL Y-17796 TaxID=767744 RepID=A0A1E4TCZ7_9ASCO|nr:hypothetical protein CANCADRAFT_32828 [Tortispora caseinolytica NRRL Y-17796]
MVEVTGVDLEKYEREWMPKVLKARQDVIDSMAKEYMLPEDKMPSPDRLNVLKLPYEAGTMSDKELTITETPAYLLVEKMAKGELTAKETLIAYLKRATIAHQILNCSTGFLIESAMARAEELDKYYAETGKVVGPLHGVPMSVKEHLYIKGEKCNAGFVAWIDRVAPFDNLQVSIMKKAGAIFFVRTNEPQSLMHPDTDNNIWGMCKNGNNLNLSSGGSSGGEGALVGFRGSPLGIGTDIGGSIRFPAAFNGCYGFRPTALRSSLLGCNAAGVGQITVLPAEGPLAQSAEDLELYMKVYSDGEPWRYDSSLAAMPWREAKLPSKLKFGIMWEDGIVAPTPPVKRGLKTVAEKLKAAGHEVVDFEATMAAELWETASKSYFADNGKADIEALAESGEPWLELTKYALGYAEPLSVEEQWRLNGNRDMARQLWLEKMNTEGIDFIICPSYLSVAPPQKKIFYWSYTAMFNVLDMPSSIFPTGLYVDPKIDTWDASYKPRSEQEKVEHSYYSPEVTVEAPITLQLVGRRFMDEDVIAATKIVSSL